MKPTLALLLAVLAAWPAPAAAQYAARRDGQLITLEDAAHRTVVSIAPEQNNAAVEMTINGHSILVSSGIPFMGPWINRLDEQAFYANGKRYAFDMELGNVRGQIPIHGILGRTAQWEVVEVSADGGAAWVTSRLDFFRRPDWMKQFPFAHTIHMTYRLRDGVLEVATRIENLSAEPMPVSVGYHPNFQLTDSRREEWRLALGARTHWLLAPTKVPTGETRPIERLFSGPQPFPIRDYNLDDVFSDLVRDEQGRATVSLIGRRQRIDVVFGENYRSAVIYSPNPANTGPGSQNVNIPAGQSPPPLSAEAAASRNFVSIEPMVAITNALNMAHRGTYTELQSIPPGGSWEASFWVRPSGF